VTTQAASGPRRIAQSHPGRRAAFLTGGVFLLLAIAVGVLVAIWDWNWFRAPAANLVSQRLHRQVTVTGDLTVHPWSWQPTATVDGVHIANPAWAGGGNMADIGRIAVTVRLAALLRGQVDLRLLEFDNPSVSLYRDPQARANWDFSGGAKSNAPLSLPPIRNFIIRDGRLQVRDDVRKLSFTGTVQARESLGSAAHGFEMNGQGIMNRLPFTLQITGGPLLNIDRNRPYPFDAQIREGATYVSAQGAVPKPFDFGHFWMNTTVRGPDLSDLYGITGVTLPNTPPYALRGRLERNNKDYAITGLNGRVGSSDLAGSIAVDSGRDRTFLKASLSTRALVFPDLMAVFGGGPKAGKLASPIQKAVAKKLAVENRIFPDTPLDADRVRQIDADVNYRAQTIRNAPIPLTSGAVHVKLDHGLLTADPLALGLPQGRLTGSVRLNARPATPVTDIDLKLSNARIEHVVPATFQGSPPFTGNLVARARLTGEGDTVHKAMGSADGQVVIVVPGGQIKQTVAELMGVNVIKGLGLLWSKSKADTPIRCGVASFQAKAGVLTTNQLVLDTEPTQLTGSGQINLDSEHLNFRLQGHPKGFQLVRLNAPIDVAGPIRSPAMKIEKGGALVQGGAALALTAVVSPLAALLPFVDAGLAKNADCAALVAGAHQQGAPVRVAKR
jgi:uncharacterized protein involved in outer membrane biogenesis